MTRTLFLLMKGFIKESGKKATAKLQKLQRFGLTWHCIFSILKTHTERSSVPTT